MFRNSSIIYCDIRVQSKNMNTMIRAATLQMPVPDVIMLQWVCQTTFNNISLQAQLDIFTPVKDNVYILKFEHRREMPPKDAAKITSREDTDQTAPD